MKQWTDESFGKYLTDGMGISFKTYLKKIAGLEGYFDVSWDKIVKVNGSSGIVER